MTSRIAENPFYILGVGVDAPRAVVEREAQKLLGMLELGLSAGTHYATPLGLRERTPDLVRWAAAELREPAKRLGHELWARVSVDDPISVEKSAPATGWPKARAVFGWRPA
jgi:hypothetical protein